MRSAETGGEVVVTAPSVLTVEGTGEFLTEPATPTRGTVAGEGLDTGPSIVTGGVTDCLLTPGSSVARLTAADIRSDTGPCQTTARTTLGNLTVLSSPASLADAVIWRDGGTPFGVHTPTGLAELSPVLEECFLIIFLSWRSNFIFLLIPLQFPDSLNVLRGEMSFRLA